MTVRVAMWSGPRNISTAMMRSWESRPDTKVVDEPFYACYLHSSGEDHPMATQVMNSQSTDWQTVIKELTTDACNTGVFYQKHMTHHMLPGLDLKWTSNLLHCFLIRDPEYVVSSYVQKRSTVSGDDIGIIRQLELYEQICEITGQAIPVIDARKTLEDPERTLQVLCEKLVLPFYKEMLQWPQGKRATDGVWASHWYGVVEQSSGFAPFREPRIDLTPEQKIVAEQSRSAYNTLLDLGFN